MQFRHLSCLRGCVCRGRYQTAAKCRVGCLKEEGVLRATEEPESDVDTLVLEQKILVIPARRSMVTEVMSHSSAARGRTGPFSTSHNDRVSQL